MRLMSSQMKRGRGRPRVTSKATLVEAAAELFLEKSYSQTTALEIAKRAGLSRNTFFNYFERQADLLWSPFDEHLEKLIAEVKEISTTVKPDSDEQCDYLKVVERISTRLISFATGYELEDIPICISQAEAMGTNDAIFQTAADRVTKLAVEIFTKLNNVTSRPKAISMSCSLAAGVVWSFIGWAQEPKGESFPDLVYDSLPMSITD